MIEVRQTDVFATWLRKLRDDEARARIQIRIRRLSLGNFGDVKPIGHGSANFASTMGLATGST
jgi:putative addiction module killer protein